ncbi:restriction endonuclease [Shivajiella indica]|uniref:Restriction endonuclease n=1 Tax=Shivajiella indica TaxID=872115 RepID=A0ABW5B1W6_9BACT
MKTEIKFSGINEDGLKDFLINHKYDDVLDLVKQLTYTTSFFDKLKEGLEILSLENAINLNVGFTLNLPIIRFNVEGDDTADNSFDNKLINAKSIKDLEEKFELSILESLLQWNQDFIDYCIFNLTSKNDSIRFKELASYYLNYSKKSEEFLPENLEELFLSEYSKVELLEEIVFHLECLRDYEFSTENFVESHFNIERPVENFFSKLTGQYKKELEDYERLRLKHFEEQEFREKHEVEIIKNYKTLISSFVIQNIKLIEKNINGLKENESSDNPEIKSIDFLLKELLDKNIINCLYEFEYELYIKNDLLLLDFLTPSFDDFLKEEKLKVNKPVIKKLEDEYRRICISILFGLTELLFKNSLNSSLNQIFLNGFAEYRDKSTGKQTKSCIISFTVSRNEFQEIDLNHIDLVLAFKRFKGISAPSISENIPIRPILLLNKEDKRFIESKDIINLVDERTNLAVMPWDDFEHFVRDLFEKEFNLTGGEVKITQSSRDGGIDAIAFDPDPIRGGKIVIQSKRYTNVVGVSAVRDLYGTMLNEGASKGILVTTSHFGGDAYEFAKNKPISLIDGDNLLNLLMKHNFKAKIDIREAKENTGNK